MNCTKCQVELNDENKCSHGDDCKSCCAPEAPATPEAAPEAPAPEATPEVAPEAAPEAPAEGGDDAPAAPAM